MSTKTTTTLDPLALVEAMGPRGANIRPTVELLTVAGADAALADLLPLLEAVAVACPPYFKARDELVAFGQEHGLRDRELTRYWRDADVGRHSPEVREAGERLQHQHDAADRVRATAEKVLADAMRRRVQEQDVQAAVAEHCRQVGAAADAALAEAVDLAGRVLRARATVYARTVSAADVEARWNRGPRTMWAVTS
jgi:hypothetical protein